MSEWKVDPSLSFAENRRRRRLALGLDPEPESDVPGEAVVVVPAEFADTIPDVGLLVSDASAELDRVAATVGILEVYDRCFGLPREDERNRTEGIKVTCPLHEEKNPSAWVNTAKETLACGHLGGGPGSGLNKFGLYCLAQGIDNSPENYHRIKRLFVWQFRRFDPYAELEGK